MFGCEVFGHVAYETRAVVSSRIILISVFSIAFTEHTRFKAELIYFHIRLNQKMSLLVTKN